MSRINVTLYGGNLPAAGIQVRADFVDGYLQFDHMALRVSVSQLVVSVGGFEHDELFLNWRDDDHQAWAAKPCTPADIAQVLATAPSSLHPELAKWHQRSRHIKTVWGTIGGIAAVCILAVIALWWQYDNAVGWVAEQIPVSTEEQLGNAAMEQMKAEGKLLESGLAVQTVRDIGGKLTQGSRYTYQWYVKTDATVNAFALPGGIVVVHSALIDKADNAGELAAVLAHEVQHIEQRHSLKHMINSLGWATLLTVVLGDVSAATAVIVHQVGTMYFSRDLEEEADRLGYATLVRHHIAPEGMVSFFKKLADEHKGQEMPSWVSSHPDTSDRIQAIQQLIKTQPCIGCKPLAIEWQAVKLSVANK